MMKKMIALLLFAALALSVFGAFAQENRVTDAAGKFTKEEIASMEESIAAIRDTYAFDVAIVTTNNSQGKTAMAYADDFYDEAGYGAGVNKDGLLFAFCFDIGEYWVSTSGSGIKAFTDYGLDKLFEYLSDDREAYAYASMMERFLSAIPAYLDAAKAGKPYDVGNPPRLENAFSVALRYLWVAVILGALAALIAVSVMIKKLYTAAPKPAANNYIRAGSLKMRTQSDLYLYKTVVRRKIEQNTGSSGHGGSSTHVSHSGATHGGRGGKL